MATNDPISSTPTDNGSDAMAGGPEPAEATASTPLASSPTGSAEPAKQAVSGTATTATPNAVIPPAYDDYAMPDDYAGGPLDGLRSWAEAHPGLALLSAAGVGLVVGRLVMALAPEPEPPSLTKRIEKRAKTLRADASDRASEYSDVASERLAKAADALRDAADSVRDRAGDWADEGSEKARDLADVIADAAKVAVAGVVAKKADSWLDRFKG